MWLNFNRVGGDTIYIYYPAILVGIALGVLLFPARAFYYRSRLWFLQSLVSLNVLWQGRSN